MYLCCINGCSNSLLSPVRAPTELAAERSAISAELTGATSALSKNQGESSLQPLRTSVNAAHPVTEELVTDEAVWIRSVLTDLKSLDDVGILRKKC